MTTDEPSIEPQAVSDAAPASMPSSSMNTPDTTLRERIANILVISVMKKGGIEKASLETIVKLEALCQEIAREARLDELKALEKRFASKGGGIPTHLRTRIAELTHKPAREA